MARPHKLGGGRPPIHGMCPRGKPAPEYLAWNAMKDRGRNPRNPRFDDYGGRGIQVCEQWLQFIKFFADMGPRPIGKTLDRINNDGHYEPGNCRWSTPKEQANNRRNNIRRNSNFNR